MLFSVLFPVILASVSLASPLVSPVKRQLAEVVYSCTKANRVALTFDDGPYKYSPQLVDTLNAKGAKGTFFVNGNNYDCIYSSDAMSRIKYAYDSGHQIGSHTWSHADLSTLTWDQVHDEMWRVELALTRIIGVVPAFMRPPYGSFNDNVLAASYVRGQKVAIWDFDSLDSDGAGVTERKERYDEIVAEHPSTLLALNHETHLGTVNKVIPYAIDILQAAGYKLVTLAECLGDEPYQSVASPQTPDDSWTC